MTDSFKLAEMQRTSIEFERQRHLANWLIKSSPHMATPSTPLSTNGGVSGAGNSTTNNTSATQSGNGGTKNSSSTSGGTITTTNPLFFLMSSNGNTAGVSGSGTASNNVVAVPIVAASQTPLPAPHHSHSNGKHCSDVCSSSRTSAATTGAAAAAGHPTSLAAAMGQSAHVEGRKPKLRRFNSHDTGANMFSVADFENARLARRNEIEMKQRLQRRMKINSVNGAAANNAGGAYSASSSCGNGFAGNSGINSSNNGFASGAYGNSSMGGDCSTGDSKGSKHSNDSQCEPLPAEIFLDRHTLPRVVRISYKTKFSHETLQSSSSNGSTSTSTQSSSGNSSGGTGGTTSTTSSSGNITNSSGINHNSQQQQQQTNNVGGGSNANTKNVATNGVGGGNEQQQQQQCGELFLLYRLIRQRHIFHGFNAKTGVANRKKGVMIPQEFSGYFSLLNDKGLPTATLYTSLIQLVRERVYKFVSVDNMPAFTESQPNPSSTQTDACLSGGYHATGPPPPPASNNRPQYVKTTARGGQVFRLLAVFEDGKQDHSNGAALSNKANSNSNHGREKEKGRYAQILNEQRQVLYVSLSTKGKFYEIEPGIPQILQKLGGNSGDQHKKINAECVHRITALVTPHKEFPMTLRFISGPSGSANSIPEHLCITRISTENIVIACPIEDVEAQSPLHLRKLHLTAEMQLLRCALGFENEQRMFANPNVQNILKFCQFNCDQFLRMVEVEVLQRAERSSSKSRGDGLRILKPLHLPKLLRREKTTISAHEKEDSIIFLSKNDLANLGAKDEATRQSLENSGSGTNRITEKMKVFQTTKKKWFRRQDKHAVTSMTSLDLDVQAKRMSMERYNDMSKLLQERFGDKRASNATEESSISERSASEIGCSDTETTTLHTIEEKLKKSFSINGRMVASGQPMLQKSLSLQDVELIGGIGGKPDLLLNAQRADTISEAGTDLDDMENRPPLQQSFITEKLYTEFHVKTRQYSKSSSSLNQLLHFAVPQKLQLNDSNNKRSLAQLKQAQRASAPEKRLDFNIGEPVTGRRAAGGLSLLAGGFGTSLSTQSAGNSQNTSLISPLTPTSLIEDDLPYSSVRDSLVLSSDESAGGPEHPDAGQICQALHMIDYTKENIYAEICHDAVAMGGIPHSQTRDTFSSNTHSTDIGGDDYGDYASLTHPYMSARNGVLNSSSSGQAVSRIHVNCTSSPVSYHTVYLGDEPLGQNYVAASSRRSGGGGGEQHRQQRRGGGGAAAAADMTNITTVACGSVGGGGATNAGANQASGSNNGSHIRKHNNHIASGNNTGNNAVAVEEVVDNIYNTLK